MTGNVDAMLALNAAHEVETSPLDASQLAEMIAVAFHVATQSAGRDGFLIAFEHDAAYDSVNFRWFQERFDRFIYVDRIIITPRARGRGLARSFYDNLFALARAKGHERIVAEINLEPPNPGSLAFHAAFGFAEVGQACFATTGKTVSYQECLL